MANIICAIVSDRTSRDLRLRYLKRILTQIQYPIDEVIKRAKKLDLKSLRTTRHKNTHNRKSLLFILTYKPRNNEVTNTIVQNLPLLIREANMNDILKRIQLPDVKSNINSKIYY